MTPYPPFQSYGTSHLIMLVLFTVGAVLLIKCGKKVRNTDQEAKVRKPIGWLIIASFFAGQAIYNLPPWDIRVALPLQLCDLAWLFTGIALVVDGPKARWMFSTWAFYWGLGLSTQGLITPATLQWDFPHIRFFAYWVCHLFIVWGAVLITFGLGYQPTWRAFRFASVTTILTAAGIFAMNVLLQTNYMFLNRKPPGESILDALGPWPQYLFWELLVIATLWTGLTLLVRGFEHRSFRKSVPYS